MGGIMIAAVGLGHLIVIKWEYHFGAKSWPGMLVGGLILIVLSLFVGNKILSGGLGMFGATLLWGILELFRQRQRVKRGWFPHNPRRKF
jgi:hypothetical protein